MKRYEPDALGWLDQCGDDVAHPLSVVAIQKIVMELPVDFPQAIEIAIGQCVR